MSYEVWSGTYKCPHQNGIVHYFYNSKPQKIKCYCRECKGNVTAKLQGVLNLALRGPKKASKKLL